ncbi:MAG TPA: sigma-70 family RNA polymerase sigma factor [Solirubrobacteraceae bacterium]|nr:sigma-70 family RNA polymerase sigma factor [Solirubrobacteraceae bacterium]
MPPDREALFAALFRQQHAAVRRYVTRRAWPDAVDDVVAETFLAAWRRFEDVPADALPWLLITARNCLSNHRRSALRGAALIERLRAQPVTASADEHARLAQRDSILRALGSLGELERELVLMTEWDGLSPRQAAAVLGVSPPAARARLYRGRRKLQLALDAELHGAAEITIGRGAHEPA